MGTFGLNALMDVGTLIPGAGTAIKTAKIVKVVKAAVKPIMKLLTLYGISNGMAAMSKIANGEDVSSEDLVDLFRGLASTAIGGKMLRDKIGDVKLAKRLEDDAIKAVKSSQKTKPSVKIEGQDIEIDPAALHNKTKAQVEEYLKGVVESRLKAAGIAFDEAKHASNLSEQFGITYKKGEFDGLN